MKNYDHIVSAVLAEPWAIRKEKLEAIAEMISLRAAGQEFTREEVLARIGDGGNTPKPPPSTGKSVAVIQIFGVISPRISMFADISGGTSIESLRQQLRAALNNPEVKAIVLDIDSPGGNVYGVQELGDEIYAGREKKKIVAQISPMAASAAYWLACQATEMVVEPSGDVGSVGVLMMHRDISVALKQAGIKVSYIHFGDYKVEGAQSEPLSEEARAYMQERVDDYGAEFVKAVARGRGLSVKDVKENFGQGRMVGAKEAKRRGMVDRIATMDETLARLGVNAGSARTAIAEGDALEVAAEMAALPVSDVIALLDGGEVQASAPSFVLGTAAPGVTAGIQAASAENHTEALPMEPNTNAAPAQAGAELATHRRDAAAIITACQRHGMADKAPDMIQRGLTPAQASQEILDAIAARTPAVPSPAAERVTATPGVAVNDAPLSTEKGHRMARFMRAMVFAKKEGGGRREAARFAEETLKDPIVAAALNASTGAGGGFTVQEALASEVIELLRPASSVRSLDPVIAPMPNGSLSLPRLATGASVAWIGENTNITATDVAFDMPKLNAKKLAALVPISNDLLRYASAGVDTIVRDDLVAALSQGEDSAFIRGLGTAFTPKGLRYLGDQTSTHIIAAQSTPDLAKVTTDLGKIRLALRNSNCRFLRPGYIFSARTENYLRNLRDSNGNFAFRTEMSAGKLDGFPFRVTTLVPDNLDTDKSEVYLADFADVVIGEVPMFVLEVSTEATYHDGSALQSAFAKDQTVIKIIREVDLGVRHPKSIAILKDVAWGA